MHKPETPTQTRRRRSKPSSKKLSVRPGIVLFDPKALEISGDWRQSLNVKLSEGNQEGEEGEEDNQQTHEDEVEDSPGAKQRRLRARVVEEICNTEKTYVSDIRTLHDHYILAFETKKHPITEDAQIAVFFNNLRHLVMLNSKLMTDIVEIVERRKEPQKKKGQSKGKRKSVKSPIAVAVQCEADGVGAIFCRYAPLFKLYGGYAKDYEEVAQRLQNYSRDTRLGFSQFLEACRERSGSSKPFESLLIMPIQRIPRYKLLLERLCELTPAEHPDAAFLTEAVTRVRDAALLINETVRRQESLEIVIQAQQQLGGQLSLSTADRRLLKSGKLTKMSTKRQEEVMIHLFNDIMLYSGVLISGGYRVRRLIYLRSKAVGAKSEIPSTIDGLFDQQSRRRVRKECCFVVTSREKTFVLFAESPAAQREWVDAITNAVCDAQKQKETEFGDTGDGNANDLDACDGPADAAALWVPDEFAGACTNCNASFRVYFRRKHHCRRCGGVVCASCSSKRAPLFVGESARVERVCTPCYKVLDLVRQVAMHWLARVVEFRGVLRRRRLDKWTEHYYELRAGVLKQFTMETAATNATSATPVAQNGNGKGFNGSGNGSSVNGAGVSSSATRRCTDELALAGAIVIHRSDSRAHKNRFCFQISTSEYDDLDSMGNNNNISDDSANSKQKASPIYRRFSQPSLRPHLMSKISPLKLAVSRFGDVVSRGREPENLNEILAPSREGISLASPPSRTVPAASPSASGSGSLLSSSSSSSAAPHESEWILCASSIQDEVAWRVAIQRSADKALHRMRRSCITECPEPLESSLSMSLPPSSLRVSMSILSGSSFIGASIAERRRASSLDRGRSTEPELSQELVPVVGDDHITCLMERRRLQILKEIIRSEESYVECLGECIQLFVQPLLLRQLEGRQMNRQRQNKRRSSLRPVLGGPLTPSARHGIAAASSINRRPGSSGAIGVSRAVGSSTSLHTMISASYAAASNSLSSTSSSSSKVLVMDADMSIFFNSVDQIYTLNQQLLDHLSRHLEEASATLSLQRDSEGVDMTGVRVHRTGAIFHAYAPLLQLYTSYASRHSAALTALDSPQFADFLRELPDKADVNRLRRYLNMPVERIPRYKMLLEELLGSTPPDHVDYAPLQSAIRSVDRVASKIEEICERRDNSRALISVSAKVGLDLTGRTFVRDGMLRKVCRSKVQMYYFVLLEDAMVYGRQGSGLHKRRFRMIDLWECKVSDDTGSMPGVITTDLNSSNAFCFYSPLKSFILLADSEEDKTGWTTSILDCIGRNLRGQTHPRSGSVPSEILGENDDDSSSGFEQEGFVIKNGWLNVSGGAVTVVTGTNGSSASAGPSIVGKKPRRLWITLTLQTLSLGTIFKIAQPEESIAVELCDVSPLKHEKCFRLQFLYDTKLRDQTTYVFEAQSLLEREEWVRALKHCTTGGDELALRRRSINAAPLAPIFMFDKVSNVCTICTHSFAVYRPRHHCRLCGSLVCGKCSKRRWTLSYSSSKKPSRICDNCAKSTVSITRSFGESPRRMPVRFAESE